MKHHADEMKAEGFRIDDFCYPWVAYKGSRTQPDDMRWCYTELESELIRRQQQVWVVMRGEKQSGGSLVGVRIDPQDAIKLALEQPVLDSGGTEWKQVDENRWECGCDYIEIEGTELK